MRVLPAEEAMTVLESQPNIIAHGIRLSVGTETTPRLGELDSFGFKEFEAVNMPTSGKGQSTANAVLGPAASSVLFSHNDGDNPHVVVTLGEKDRLMRDILYVCRLKRDPLEVAPSNLTILPHLISTLQGASRRIGESWRYHADSSQPDFYSS